MVVETTLLEMWKSVHHDLPIGSLFDQIPAKPSLRQKTDSFVCPPCSASKPEWFISKGAALWNKLPADVRSETHFLRAKKLIKDFTVIYAFMWFKPSYGSLFPLYILSENRKIRKNIILNCYFCLLYLEILFRLLKCLYQKTDWLNIFILSYLKMDEGEKFLRAKMDAWKLSFNSIF